jgi:molybdenum cofactor cytidylyltransferase
MVPAILLAAGQSLRMGTPKQLLPFGDTTVIGHIVDQLLQGGVDGVYVVVGHEAERIRQALGDRPVRFVPNPDYRQGEMLSSVRCGLRALPAACTGIFVALGDQPAISVELVRAMLGAFPAASKGILVPTHGGKRGHPLLVAERYRSEILTRFDEFGLRGLLAAHPEDVLECPAQTSAVLSDMDDPEDYRRELARRAAELRARLGAVETERGARRRRTRE